MICIHNYLRICETGSMPPGLVDFLRGTVALYSYCKKYGYRLFINRTIHPVFQYFQNGPCYIENVRESISGKTIELLSQASAPFVDHIIERLFQNNNDIYVLTNCLLESKHTINNDCKSFIKNMLTPSNILSEHVSNVLSRVGLHHSLYQCIHIRFGDSYMHKKTIENSDEEIILSILPTIHHIRQSTDIPILLLSDSTIMANEIKKREPSLLYWDNQKIHLGNLENNNEDSILDTLTDMLLLSTSKHISTINISTQFKTTFSPFIAMIFDIENHYYQLQS